MFTNKLTVNGEILDVTAILQPFTHDAPSGVFDGLGKVEILDVVIGQSLNEGFLAGQVKFKTETEPTIDNLNTYLAEYPDNEAVVLLETDSGLLLASGSQAVAV